MKVFCIETNDFPLSGTVLMVARRVVTTRVLTRNSICSGAPVDGGHQRIINLTKG
jgi:hypothetical protein